MTIAQHPQSPQHRRVVVGIDGSGDADAALYSAAQEAILRKARLDFVHVWAPPSIVGPVGAVVLPIGDREYETAAREILDQKVDGIVGRLPDPPATERILVRSHDPAHALTATAKDADLLVIGSRGRGSFTGLILGSVSQQCVHQAHCPVLVVPAAAQAA